MWITNIQNIIQEYDGTLAVIILFIVSKIQKHENTRLFPYILFGSTITLDTIFIYILPRGRTKTNITFFAQNKWSQIIYIFVFLIHVSKIIFKLLNKMHIENSDYIIDKRRKLYKKISHKNMLNDRRIHLYVAIVVLFLVYSQIFNKKTYKHVVIGYSLLPLMGFNVIYGMKTAISLKRQEFYYGLMGIAYSYAYLLIKAINHAREKNIDTHKLLILPLIGLPLNFSIIGGFFTVFAFYFRKYTEIKFPQILYSIIGIVLYDVINCYYDVMILRKTNIPNHYSYLLTKAVPYIFIFITIVFKK